MAVSAPLSIASNDPIMSSISDNQVRRISSFEKAHCKAILPEDFKPTPYSVICGRGRKVSQAIGNRRLQVIAQMFITRYAQSSRKEEKSKIVSDILEMVRDAAQDKRYAFIRYYDGRWWEVEPIQARGKFLKLLVCKASL